MDEELQPPLWALLLDINQNDVSDTWYVQSKYVWILFYGIVGVEGIP